MTNHPLSFTHLLHHSLQEDALRTIGQQLHHKSVELASSARELEEVRQRVPVLVKSVGKHPSRESAGNCIFAMYRHARKLMQYACMYYCMHTFILHPTSREFLPLILIHTSLVTSLCSFVLTLPGAGSEEGGRKEIR